MAIILRNSTFHLKKRVPRRFARIESRKEVWISLSTDSRRDAVKKADRVWEVQISAWEARLAGDTSDAEARFEAARNLAQARGYRFLPVDKVARLPLPELLDRIDAAHDAKGRPDMLEADALLGGAVKPEITVERALEMFWALADDRTLGKSEDQIRRWRNPRIKAINNFVGVCGNLPINEITGDDMLDFRDWWWHRIRDEGLTPNSANKDLTHLANVLRTVNQRKRLGLALPLDGLAFKEGEKRSRPPIPDTWIRDVILKPGALNGLNKEARCIVLGMINTGYRPSEGAGLHREQIHLDCDYPHIEILPIGRTLKSQYSKRTLPLVGISLEAFKECPDGFPRYFDKPGLSDTINSYMRDNGLYPSKDHTIYGLRHSFEDRLLAGNVDERIRRDLLGHSLNRERYGEGASLEQVYKIVKKLAI